MDEPGNALDRRREIHELLKLAPREVRDRAGGRLVVCRDLDGLHQRFARDLARIIRAAHRAHRDAVLILPVGPTGQYPILAEIVNREGLPLHHVHMFFMDEYADDAGKALPATHPLSFKGAAERVFFSRLRPELRPNSDQVVFPDENNIDSLARRIGELGGVDFCGGGIGIHGHIAFNEPEPRVSELGPRQVNLNDFTRTINVVRARVGGNIEGFPRLAYTLGMREILASRCVRLYCRNGCEFDWANTVLRLALFGNPGDDYPVTWVRERVRDFVLTTDCATLASPKIVL
ncbi:MAG: glucosamine-6-phosphate isomerase [Kiritimatiellaeota bacterium]|nr:glucosamine-6-phosphate isomerase [Kiritimatiellota bacterium]